jgi:hypothetical protein
MADEDGTLRYLHDELVAEERRNSQVIPLPEESALLPPPVVAPILTATRKMARNTVFLNLIVGCIAIAGFFLINFFVWGESPSHTDIRLAVGALLVLWYLSTLDARERRQQDRFDTIERDLAEIKRKLDRR